MCSYKPLGVHVALGLDGGLSVLDSIIDRRLGLPVPSSWVVARLAGVYSGSGIVFTPSSLPCASDGMDGRFGFPSLCDATDRLWSHRWAAIDS